MVGAARHFWQAVVMKCKAIVRYVSQASQATFLSDHFEALYPAAGCV
jgi:hypothetical protein